MDLYGLMNEHAEKNGIILGICDALPLDKFKGGLTSAPFVNYTANQRTNPSNLLENAKSIIVIGVGYNRRVTFSSDEKKRGAFSLNAAGLDYHIIVRQQLESLRDFLFEKGVKLDCFISVDTGPLPEKILAVKAGLGWVGKNGLVISQEFGSFFNIGYMVTNLDFKFPDSENEKLEPLLKPGSKCGVCNMCIKSCPGEALSEEGFNYLKCVSYLTQKKGDLTANERKSIGICLYGCDVCQKVCGYNANTYVGEINSIDYLMPTLDSIISMPPGQFKEKYKSTAIFWRGQKVLKRNAEIAEENLCNMNIFPF